MPVTHFQRLQTTDKEINLLQNRLAETLDSMTQNPLLNGILLQQKALVAGSNLVTHGLGRNYISFLFGNPSTPVRLSVGASPDPKTVINIIADVASVVDLYTY